MTPPEEDRFAAFNAIQEECLKALGEGRMQITMTLDTLAWIDIIQEIKGRNPRNYSQLLRDDMMDRMEAAIERLHDEATYLAIAQPGSIAKKMDPARPRPPARSGISSELAKNLRGPKP